MTMYKSSSEECPHLVKEWDYKKIVLYCRQMCESFLTRGFGGNAD